MRTTLFVLCLAIGCDGDDATSITPAPLSVEAVRPPEAFADVAPPIAEPIDPASERLSTMQPSLASRPAQAVTK